MQQLKHFVKGQRAKAKAVAKSIVPEPEIVLKPVKPVEQAVET